MRSAIVLAAAFLAGCATPLITGGDQVRQITADGKTGCQFVRMVEVEGGLIYSSRTEAERDMLSRLRNATITAGGNAFSPNRIVVERGFSLPFAQADAYRCPT